MSRVMGVNVWAAFRWLLAVLIVVNAVNQTMHVVFGIDLFRSPSPVEVTR